MANRSSNLTGGLLIATAARLQSFATAGGRLVLSGFMDSEERDVLAFGGHRDALDHRGCARSENGGGQAA